MKVCFLLKFLLLMMFFVGSFASVKNYMYVMKNREWIQDLSFLENPAFDGAQIVYSWKELEPKRNKYNFKKVREDILFLNKYGKKLFIQLKDVSFSSQFKPVPNYILSDEFDGGVAVQKGYNPQNSGWMALRWNIKVRGRFQKLIQRLGKEFDGKVAGINLQESAFSIMDESKLPSDYSHSKYRDSIIDTMKVIASSFKKSKATQYANFMPGEWLPYNNKGYLKSLYLKAADLSLCMGAPDLIPNKKSLENHSYKFMRDLPSNSCKVIAVQNGNYSGTTATTSSENLGNNVAGLYNYATKDLGVSYIFWVKQEPYFTSFVIPFLSKNNK